MASTRHESRRVDRALGALLGCAIGDAMGMPSQTMSPDDIFARYGRIEGFCPPFAGHPVSAGLPAATITDDTEQALLLAEQILRSPDLFDARAWGCALLEWERDTRARGVHDLLGPSTKRALDALMRGVPPSETGRLGMTNGAAMRIAPVGIATPPRPLSRFIERVAEASRITHNTAEAIGAAAAVASVISQGVDGMTLEDALNLALDTAAAAERVSEPASPVRITERMARALELAARIDNPSDLTELANEIGTGVAATQSVPMAFAIARIAGGDACKAAVLSANIGGDTDTIGAIAASMVGACTGAAMLPQACVADVTRVNGLDLVPIAKGLLAIRAARSAELRELP